MICETKKGWVCKIPTKVTRFDQDRSSDRSQSFNLTRNGLQTTEEDDE